MSAPSTAAGRFDLEQLEPRLLLSGSPGACAAAPASELTVATEMATPLGDELGPAGEGTPASASADVGCDLFAGVPIEVLSPAGLAAAGPVALPTPLSVLPPAGARIHTLPSVPPLPAHEPGRVRGAFTGSGDTQTFALPLDPRQSISLALWPWDTEPQAAARVEILDPEGKVLGTASGSGGNTTLLQSVEALTAGDYTIRLTSLSGPFEYALQLLLNAAWEAESKGGTPNDAPTEAQVLALSPGTAGMQSAVWGVAPLGDVDAYRLDLTAGEPVSFAVASATLAGEVDLEVFDASGTRVALGAGGLDSGSDQTLGDFLVPVSGSYRVQVTGKAATATPYGLVIQTGLGREREPNDAVPDAQPLQAGAGVTGWMDVPGYDVEPDDFPSGTALTQAVPGVTLTVEGITGTVTSLTSTRRSTGLRSFGYGGGAEDYLWSYTTPRPMWLRIEFAAPVDFVSIDAIARDTYPRTWAVFEAYDASGRQIATVDTGGGAGQNTVRTLAISRPRPEIKYVRATGLGGYRAGLDNLRVGTDRVDTFAVRAEAGKVVQLRTSTPGDGGGEPHNDLDLQLEVFDAGGARIAWDQNGAADGRNAALDFTAGPEVYTVKVSGRGRGDYVLHVTGATLVNPAPSVLATVPTEAGKLAHAPATLDVGFTEPVRPTALDPAALIIEGRGPATAATLIDGRTVRYTVGLDAMDTEGPYAFSLAAGAVTDLQGAPSLAHIGKFFVDRTGPSVVAHHPSPTTPLPLGVITLTFTEPIQPTSVTTADVVTFTGPGGINLKPRVTRLEVEGREVRVVFSPLQIADGTYTLVVGPGIEDYVGNRMDQDHDGTYGETTADRYTAIVDLAPPNLAPVGLTVSPSPAVFGQTVDVSWTTRNTGRGAAAGPWNVWIWLSQDGAVSPATDHALQSFLSPTPDPLPALSDHPQTTTVTLPLGPQFVAGTYHVLVQLDSDGVVFESLETDNLADVMLNLALPQLPDLEVNGTVAPPVSSPGSTVAVQWTVTNTSAGPAEQDWRDSVYLSTDAVFDEATDLWLATYDAQDDSPLRPGTSYTVTRDLVLPHTTSAGAYYLIVVADRYNQQLEGREDNNTAPLPLDLRAPDLLIPFATGPPAARFGDAVDLAWTIANAGTYAVAVPWTDRVWLSNDGTLDAQDRLLLARTTTAAVPFVAAGTPHSETATVRLPLTGDLSAGNYHLLIQTDAGMAVPELDEGNNLRAIPITLALPPLPDLTVSGVSSPTDAYSGTAIPVQWTLTNQGGAPASGRWMDRVVLADNPAGTNGLVLGEFAFDGTLAAGASVIRRQTVTLPLLLEGSKWVVVTADADQEVYEHLADGNNTSPGPQPLLVRLSPFPNLQVPQVTAPSDAFSFQEILVEWVVTNTGTGDTTVSDWTDEVWLSSDRLWDGNDQRLGQASNASALAAGDSYRNSLTLQLPIDAVGPFYVLIRADPAAGTGTGRVIEPGHEDDNVGASSPVAIALTPPPDLQVTTVVAPPAAIGGESILVRWTVANRGPGPTAGAERWEDFVFLSVDDRLDWGASQSTDLFLGKLDHQGALGLGEAYSANRTCKVPADIAGEFYVFVFTNWDPARNLFENGFTENNATHTTNRMTILPKLVPDLEPRFVDMPATGLAGHELMLSWSILNAGPGATPAAGWTEAFFLSDDSVWDAQDLRMATFSTAHPSLAPGQSYDVPQFPLQVPVGVAGNFYLLLRADYSDLIRETNETNNTVASTHRVNIESRPADLVATLISSPAQAMAGQAIRVGWTVTNQGTGDSIAEDWDDGIYLNPGERRIATVPHDGRLNPGGSYAQSAVVTLPGDLPGAYALYVKADAPPHELGLGAVYEADREGNNDTPTAALNVTFLPPDLRITRALVPTSLTAGTTITLEWTVTNQGPGATLSEGWHDRVLVSVDRQADAEDLVLHQRLPNRTTTAPLVHHSGRLQPGETYQVTSDFAVPATLTGTFFLIFQTDSQETVREGEETNNTWTSADALSVVPGPAPNLKIESATTPAAAFSGTAIDLHWVGRNDGASTSTSWWDYAYLSTDQVFDGADDFYLGRVEHETGLGSGATYPALLNATLPRGLTGALYVFILTDRTHRVYEGAGETDNLSAPAGPILVTLAPRADLNVSAVTVADDAIPGQPTTLSYTVANASDSAAVGPWYDSIYLSTDGRWDLDDPLVARVARDSLAARSSATWQVTAPLPAVVPGRYHVLVRTDIRNQLRETNEGNNLGASTRTIAVDAPRLLPGVPATGTLAAQQAVYYRVTTSANETLLITLDSVSPRASTELYVRFGQMPTRAEFDYRFTAPFAPDQQVVVPVTLNGTYYVLLYGDDAPSPAPTYTVTARWVQFEVLDASYGKGGTAGNLTLQINGANFDRTVTAELARDSGFRLPAASYWYVDSSRLYATFDLTRTSPGPYHVVVTKPGSGVAQVRDGLEVVAGGGGVNQPYVWSPEWVGMYSEYPFVVSWFNNGLNDAPAPLIAVHADGVQFSPTPGAAHHRTGRLFLGTSSDDGPPAILRPGQSESLTFFAFMGDPQEVDTFTVGRVLRDPTQPFDWEAIRFQVRSEIMPMDLPDLLFDQAFDRMLTQNGPTNADFLRMLGRNALLLPDEIGSPRFTENLIRLEMVTHLAALQPSIAGAGQSADFAVDLSGRLVVAQHLTTGQTYTTRSLNDGSFAISPVPAGDYQLTFEGAVVRSGSSVSLAVGQSATQVQLDLVPGGMVRGTVRDQTTGDILPDVHVRAMSATGSTLQEATTDAAGVYELSALEPGQSYLVAERTGHARFVSAEFTVGTGTLTQDLVLLPGSALTGLLQFEPGGPAIGTPAVTAILRSGPDTGARFAAVVTDQRFAVSQLPAGVYDLLVVRDGYLVRRLENLTLLPDTALDAGTILLARAASLTGHVLSHIPGQSAANLLVGVSQAGNPVAAVLTNAQGQFRFNQLVPGAYTVQVIPTFDAIGPSLQPTLSAGENTVALPLELWPGATVVGQVLESASHTPASGITVSAFAADGTVKSAITDATGRYRLPALAPGRWVVRLPTGGPDATRILDLVGLDAREWTANLEFTSVAGISGRLLYADLTPVIGGSVDLARDRQSVASASTDANGRFEFHLLQPGTFALRASAPTASFAPISALTATAGQNVTVDFVAGQASLQVEFDPPEGPPVGAIVTLRQRIDAQRFVISQTTIEAGKPVRFTHLVAGDYLVEVEASDHRGATTEISLAATGDNTVRVSVATWSRLSGSVTDATGLPLPNAEVLLYAAGVPDPMASRLTSADGAYALSHLAAGNYVMVVTAKGHAARVFGAVPVAGDQVLDVSLLAATTEVSGQCLDGYGLPVLGAVVILKDQAGRILDQAVVAPDGTFQLTSGSGDALSLSVRAVGFGGLTRDNLTLTPGTLLALGSLPIEAFALGRTTPPPNLPGAWFSPTASLPSGATLLNAGGGGGPAWYSILYDLATNLLRSEAHVEPGEVVALPSNCLETCGVAWQWAYRMQAYQDRKYDLFEDQRNLMLRLLVIAGIQFDIELLSTVGTLGAIVAVGTQLLSAVGAITLATSTTAALSGTTMLVFNIVSGLLSMVGAGLGLCWQSPDVPDPNASASVLEQAETVTGWSTSVASELQTCVDLLYKIKAWPDLPWGTAFTVVGAIGLISGWRSIWQHLTFQDAIATCRAMGKQYNDWKFARTKYETAVSEARQRLDNYLACLPDCGNDDQDQGNEDRSDSTSLGTLDPNDIVGPAGYGDEHWIPVSEPLQYLIRCENDPVLANAPVRTLRIIQQLDPDLDPRSFRVGDFGFGSLRVKVPPNRAYYSDLLDLTASHGLLLHVAAGLNLATQQAFWQFTALDPTTGDLTQDPRLGFLPPNITAPEGQGWVTYTILPQPNARSGDVLEAQATIIFDDNEPIDTPAIFNTVDAVAPTSEVQPLPATTPTPLFQVSWSGADDSTGSTLVSYTVYVSRDGGPFEAWLSDTPATAAPFQAEPGHRYAFYTVARDQAGNRENPPTLPDTTTLVAGGVAVLEGRVWIDANGNGLREEAEPRRPGVQVELFTHAGERVGTTTTDALGSYQFDQLDPVETYALKFKAPDNWRFTNANQGGDDTRDSDVDPVSGWTPPFTLTPGPNVGWDAGFRTPAPPVARGISLPPIAALSLPVPPVAHGVQFALLPAASAPFAQPWSVQADTPSTTPPRWLGLAPLTPPAMPATRGDPRGWQPEPRSELALVTPAPSPCPSLTRSSPASRFGIQVRHPRNVAALDWFSRLAVPQALWTL